MIGKVRVHFVGSEKKDLPKNQSQRISGHYREGVEVYLNSIKKEKLRRFNQFKEKSTFHEKNTTVI